MILTRQNLQLQYFCFLLLHSSFHTYFGGKCICTFYSQSKTVGCIRAIVAYFDINSLYQQLNERNPPKNAEWINRKMLYIESDKQRFSAFMGCFPSFSGRNLFVLDFSDAQSSKFRRNHVYVLQFRLIWTYSFSLKVEQSISFSAFTPRVRRPWRALLLSPWWPLLGTDNLGQQGALDWCCRCWKL